MEAVAEKKGTSALEGKYLTFNLGNEVYGIEILKAREIIGLMDRYYQCHKDFDLWQTEGKHFVCRIRKNTHKTVMAEKGKSW